MKITEKNKNKKTQTNKQTVFIFPPPTVFFGGNVAKELGVPVFGDFDWNAASKRRIRSRLIPL